MCSSFEDVKHFLIVSFTLLLLFSACSATGDANKSNSNLTEQEMEIEKSIENIEKAMDDLDNAMEKIKEK